MPAQTDPDAQELLRRVEEVQQRPFRRDGTLEDSLRYRGVAEAALLPLLKAVVGIASAPCLCRMTKGDTKCVGCDARTALRAVAEALGEAHG